MQNSPTEKEAAGDNPADSLVFSHWPAFAGFVREQHVVEYARELLHLSREADLPIMKLIAHMPEEQLLELTIQGHGEFLEKVEQNVLREHLDAGLKKWEDNKLEIISNDEIATEDITIGTFIRKKALLKFLPLYTTDPYEIIDIIKEIDAFDTASITASTKLHFSILKGKIQEQVHFIEKISDTTPGLTYVYDINKNIVKYANKNYLSFFGYTLEDIQGLGAQFSVETVHPEDIARGTELMKLVPQMSNTDTLTLENRLKNAKGKYKWVRHYFSIFKRDEQNKPVEVIGIALDIENEKRASEKLANSEEQLLEAQAIGELGSFEWTFADESKTTVTPQLLHILGLDDVVGFVNFMNNVHPTDRPKVQQAIDHAIKKNEVFECEFRYINHDVEKIIWSRGVVEYKNGVARSMKGTIMDVTERNHMIHRLKRSEELYKQAQALSHMGNYAYDIVHNKMHWTDELYRIFGLEPQAEEITMEKFLSLVHPEDRDYTARSINESIEKRQPHNFHYRILLQDGTEKILQAIGEVLADENGVVYKFLGTAQDVTEKQKLINNLQQAQSMAHIGNWSWDLSTDMITWSDEMFRIYGLAPTEGSRQRKDYTALRHPDDVKHIEQHISQLLKTHEPQEYQFRVILKDGKVKHLHARAEVVVNNEGKPVTVFGTLQDITEKQMVINRLQDREALYKQAQAMSHIGNWTWTLANNEVIWSDEMFHIYGLENVEGGKLDLALATSFRHPDDRAYVAEMVNKVVETKSQYQYRYRIISPAGDTRILDAISETILDDNGKVLKVIGTVQDVTEKVLIEQQVNESREFIKKIADTAPSIITSYNINTGRYNFVSGGITKLLGYDPSLVLEQGVAFFNERLHPDDLAQITEKNNEAVSMANKPESHNDVIVEEFKYRVKDANGKYRWLHTYGTVFDRNSEGKVEHVLNISVDISAQVEAEQGLQEKNIQLQQSNSSLEDYAYVASHDLKEPLRKIATFSDRLITTQKDILSEEGKLYLTKIIDSSKRMQLMINDLLAVSTISGNKAFETYSLQKTVREALQVLEHKIEENKATVKVGELPEAYIVPSQFRQLFQNLISNSLKFARAGVPPTITIEAGYLRPEQVKMPDVAKAERYLQIKFSDNGIGFHNTYAEKIFSIFQRLHSRSEYDGTGIGLAICRKVAENHGGTIYAEGKENEGAKFTIIIPA